MPSLRTWIQATSLGWLLGIPLIVILALAAEGVGIGGVQAMVGLGIGSGVGLLQARALRPWMIRPFRWAIVTGIGLCLPFVAVDLLPHLGHPVEFSLTRCVVVGGVLVGVGQAFLLRSHLAGASLWIPFAAAGWAAAAGVAALADQLTRSGARGVPGALAYIVLVALGGPMLGLVSGLGFVRRAGTGIR